MKLNLGSGDVPLDGYRNLDAKTRDKLYPLAICQGEKRPITGDPYYDREELVDNSADEIRASHVLEHFPHYQTLSVLKEWVRVLKPGGWLKIAVPDFDWIWGQRKERTNVSPELLEMYLFGGQVDDNDYHKALFTNKKLYELLQSVGLTNIQTWTSEIQDCASLPVSLNLMGQKPEVSCQSWEYPDGAFNPRSRAIQCPQPVIGKSDAGFSYCEKHLATAPRRGQKPEVATEVERIYKVDPSAELKAPPIGALKQLHQMYEGQSHCFKCGKPSDRWSNTADECKGGQPSTSRTQVFAAGRWQDLDGSNNIEVVDHDELMAVSEGRVQTRTIVSDGKRAARIALCLSTPRIGFLRPLERLLALAHSAGISLFSGDGVFFHHALSRSIRNACEFYFEDSGEGFDFILTADYDTYALLEDVHALASLLARSPEADCIVPLQMKRGGTGEILAGGENMNLTQSLVPIQTGHFGLTMFRKEFFERLPTPWFYEKPDAEGHWGDGRTDADIGFWLNAKKAKLNVMLASQIVVGHGEELVVYPQIINGKCVKVYQAVNDWLTIKAKPEGVGVIT